MTILAQRLSDACRTARFTVADMALWCGADRGAMREWIRRGVTPNPVNLQIIEERLTLLYRVLNETKRLPIPIGTRLYQHKKYIKDVLDYALERFSDGCTPGRRV